jgi:hypothetical protein
MLCRGGSKSRAAFFFAWLLRNSRKTGFSVTGNWQKPVSGKPTFQDLAETRDQRAESNGPASGRT